MESAAAQVFRVFGKEICQHATLQTLAKTLFPLDKATSREASDCLALLRPHVSALLRSGVSLRKTWWDRRPGRGW